MTRKDIKMLGLDLDGTLLTRKKELTGRTKETLQKAIGEGIIVLPATGRPLSGLPEELMSIPGIKYAVTANGARVLDVTTGEVLSEQVVPYEIGASLLDILSKYDTLLEVYYDGIGYADRGKLQDIQRYLKEVPMAGYVRSTRRPVEDVVRMFKEMKRPTDKVQAIFADLKDKYKAMEEIAEVFSEKDIAITGALSNNIEVNAGGVNKWTGLECLGQMLGISGEQIMACGDGANDLEMVKMAGLGIAMANSMEEVLAAADEITCSNDEEGVALAIEKYILK